jgi:GxxExxY protein
MTWTLPRECNTSDARGIHVDPTDSNLRSPASQPRDHHRGDESSHRARPWFSGKHLHACLQYELAIAGVRSATQVGLPVVYCGVKLELGYRIDLLAEDLLVVEIKSVEAVSPVHHAQILSYLKLGGKSIGLLINFNVVHLRDGIKRFVNGTNWK